MDSVVLRGGGGFRGGGVGIGEGEGDTRTSCEVSERGWWNGEDPEVVILRMDGWWMDLWVLRCEVFIIVVKVP